MVIDSSDDMQAPEPVSALSVVPMVTPPAKPLRPAPGTKRSGKAALRSSASDAAMAAMLPVEAVPAPELTTPAPAWPSEDAKLDVQTQPGAEDHTDTVVTEPVRAELAAPEIVLDQPDPAPQVSIAPVVVPEPVVPEPVVRDPVVPVPVLAVAAAAVPVLAEAANAARPGARTTPTASLTHSYQHSLEIAMTTTTDFLAQGQANVEAVIKSGQIWTSGFQELGRTIAESAQAQFDHTVGTWKALAGTKSLKEAFDIQSSRARAALEKAVADTSKVTDASLKLAEQAMAPIAARLTVATESFPKPV